MDNYSSWRPLIGFKTKQGVVQLDKPVIDSIKAISLQSIEIKHNYNPKVTGYKLTYTAGSHSYMDNSSDVDGVMYGRVFHAGLEVQVKMLGTGSNGYTTDWSDPYKFVMPKIQQPIIIKLENRNNAYLDVEWMG